MEDDVVSAKPAFQPGGNDGYERQDAKVASAPSARLRELQVSMAAAAKYGARSRAWAEWKIELECDALGMYDYEKDDFGKVSFEQLKEILASEI